MQDPTMHTVVMGLLLYMVDIPDMGLLPYIVDIPDMDTVLLAMGRFNNFEIFAEVLILFLCRRKGKGKYRKKRQAPSTASDNSTDNSTVISTDNSTGTTTNPIAAESDKICWKNCANGVCKEECRDANMNCSSNCENGVCNVKCKPRNPGE